jgi:hypothetical protein
MAEDAARAMEEEDPSCGIHQREQAEEPDIEQPQAATDAFQQWGAPVPMVTANQFGVNWRTASRGFASREKGRQPKPEVTLDMV